MEKYTLFHERNIARIDAAFAILHNHIDGKLVVMEQLFSYWQRVELLYFAGGLADAPAHQHVEFHVSSLTDFHQSRHIERLDERYHRYW